MKKERILSSLLLSLLVVPVMTVSAVTKDVKTVEAEYVNGSVIYSGTTDAGVVSVSCGLYDKNNKEVDFKSSAVDKQEFADSFDIKEDEYTIKCANYSGGSIVSSKVMKAGERDLLYEMILALIDEGEIVPKEDVAGLVEAIVQGEEVTGISDELANKIANAVELQKSIKIDIVTNEVKEEDVKQDAKNIFKLVGGDGKVVALYDVSIIVYIDDKEAGKITNVGEEIDITVKVPGNLKEVANGYERSFYVVRVHEGKAEKLAAILNKDGTLTFKTNLFSTYAIAYEDKKAENSPKTGDTVLVSIVLAAISIVGLGAIVVKKKLVK